MFKNHTSYILSIAVFLTVRCTSSSFEITGVDQNGLDGACVKGAKEEKNTFSFIKKKPKDSDMILVAEKKGYPALEYYMSSRISNLSLGIFRTSITIKI
jgi:hypothetical protein